MNIIINQNNPQQLIEYFNKNINAINKETKNQIMQKV